jgi:PAS domain S-box-containing protein
MVEEDWHHLIFENSFDGIVLSAVNGDILDANRIACEMLGYEKEQLLALKVRCLFFEEDLQRTPLNYGDLLEGRTVSNERRLQRKDGGSLLVELNTKMIPGGSLLGVFRDITEKKKALQKIRESEENFRILVENTHDLIARYDKDYRFIYMSPAGRNFLHFVEGEILGKNLYELGFPVEVAEDAKRLIGNVFRTGQMQESIRELQTPAGTYYLETRLFPEFDDEGRVRSVITYSQDVTELRHLSSYLQSIREEERTSIAREIHDELGQQLTGLKMDIFWLSNKILPANEAVTAKIGDIFELIDGTIDSVRRIASELRPSMLDNLGLVEAMEWQTTEFTGRTGIQVNFSAGVRDTAIPPDIATGLFRIYQEALTNITRHSDAATVTTTLNVAGGNIILTIRDDGRGFDPGLQRAKKTWGLVGMKERALMMGGRYRIDSKPTEGALIMVEVPLPA